jgi:hypothetical protein
VERWILTNREARQALLDLVHRRTVVMDGLSNVQTDKVVSSLDPVDVRDATGRDTISGANREAIRTSRREALHGFGEQSPTISARALTE